MTDYFVHATVWSALGLVIGIMIGTGIRVRFLGKGLDARGRDRLVGAALIAIALISTAQGLVFQRQQRSVTECQVHYNVQFQRALRERAGNTDRDRANTNKMVQDVLSAPDREAVRKALQRYVDVNRQLEAERKGLQYPVETGANCK